MPNKNNINELIGSRIKFIRKKKRKTLQQISEESGFSVGYLSNLERGINSPTVDQLQKICSVLDVNITNILSDKSIEKEPLIVRGNERKVIFQEDEKVKYELLSEGEHDLEGICITMTQGVDYETASWGHGYDELGMVLKGRMSIEMLGNEYILETGDSLYIEKNTLHAFRNAGQEECVSCWYYINQK